MTDPSKRLIRKTLSQKIMELETQIEAIVYVRGENDPRIAITERRIANLKEAIRELEAIA